MPTSTFSSIRISGVVTCVPTQERWIDDDLDLFGGNVKQLERLKKTIGLNRRVVVDDGVTAADLCAHAAKDLLAGMGVAADQVDGMICVTQTPDHSQPCNAAILHGRLGMPTSCAAFDVSLGCSGYVYGLWLAHMMVASGGCERVLLLAGDTISRLVHPKDRSVATLFGDGGSATMVERGDAERGWFSLETDGKGSNHLIVPAGGFRQPKSDTTVQVQTDAEGNLRTPENLYMNGSEIFNFSISEEPRAVREIVEFAGVDIDAIDAFVFHQANRYIISSIAKRLKIETAKVPMGTVERYGNQSSASIPCALCGELDAQLLDGKKKTILLSGFGVGLSWASAILELGAMDVCRIVNYGVEN